MIEDKILVRKIHTTDTRKRNKDTLDNKVFDTDVSLLFSLPEEAEARAGSAWSYPVDWFRNPHVVEYNSFRIWSF